MVSVRETLELAARGEPPPVDGLVEVVPRPTGVAGAVLAFTGHHLVAADVDPEWVAARLRPWDLSAPFAPPFLADLSARLGVPAGTLDAVLVGPQARTEPALVLRRLSTEAAEQHLAASPHPRGNHAVWQTPDGAGTLVLGRGLAGRWEVRFDVEPSARGQGLGRALAAAAIRLVPPGELVFAQAAPGNVASLRALLAAGYRPIGAEVLFFEPAPAAAEPGRATSP